MNARRPMPVAPEFSDVFIYKGWRKCESMWGKATADYYRRVIGAKNLEQMKEDALAIRKHSASS